MLEFATQTALGAILRRRCGGNCGGDVGQTLDTGRLEFEGGEPAGEGDLQILDRVAHIIPAALLEIVKSPARAAEAERLASAGRPRSASASEGQEVTRAARWRAKRAKRAIRALQIAGLWPQKDGF